ncbi:MAG: phosphoribosylformylglycinamidine synthase [Deltaproteobacteria bacterium]|nr:phosphoribosylformylglycinamidine synthase [Deltaproteobacteria bacterium]
MATDTAPACIHVALRDGVRDLRGEQVACDAARFLGIDTGRVRTSRLYAVGRNLSRSDLERLGREGLADRILHEVTVGGRPESRGARTYVLVGRLPGVTDDEGMSAQATMADLLALPPGDGAQEVFSSEVYLFERDLPPETLARLAEELLGNPLIHHFEYGPVPDRIAYAPRVRLPPPAPPRFVDLEVSDAELERLSKERVLSLDLKEMHAIRDHFRNPEVRARLAALDRPGLPTDAELEIFAQTWSEHCKHKEFNALIEYHDEDTGQTTVVDSLFRTYIRGTTDPIAARLSASGQDWLVKVFTDNAGVVRVDSERLFVLKVETHNTPSALDPYGGAITGILGNNRDPLGTGRGGARCLFNTNVLCFGPPNYARPLLPGQLHPRRVLEGVRRGIEDGGNKSGIPTVHGAIVFDDRYAGKPLVYCGTGALLPSRVGGRNAWEKEARPGDAILMAGGRVGKDGIHGATFSSVEIDRNSPRSAVQVGSPITQKRLADFLEAACLAGFVRCTTDNGAGGLSSSVGELAPLAGGAEVHLDRVPLKYEGLAPWEIFVSESQERMTLVVDPVHLPAILEVARLHEVEVSDVGRFTDSGLLEVFHSGARVASLDLDFLHHGVPSKRMRATWRAPALTEPVLPPDLDWGHLLRRVLASPDVASREWVIRQYDHEVKGRTVVKPLMGPDGTAPQDAAVMRLGFDDWRGLAVSCGIVPRYGDIDPYAMSAAAFDEAVRQIVAVGGRLPDPDASGGTWWSACDNFCVPDSAWHPTENPDGDRKLGALVRMCRALKDVATAYGVPLTSGKDSMKNDFKEGGVRISVPPTVLYTVVSGIEDIRRTVTSEVKAEGDFVWVLGRTRDELGASILYRLLGELGANVPRVRTDEAVGLYRALASATTRGWVASCHDCSDGGLAVALAEATFGTGLGLDLDLGPVLDALGDAPHPVLSALFSESPSRFVATVAPEHQASFEASLGEHGRCVGRVTADPRLVVRARGAPVLDLDTLDLLSAWRTDPRGGEGA